MMALVIALVMTMMYVVPMSFAAAPDYKITVTNSNESVSINGQEFTAYKLFENTYEGMSDDPYTGTNTQYGLDSDPHAYYIKKENPFGALTASLTGFSPYARGQPRDVKDVPDFYPVVTIVLYFGDTHWNQSFHLKDHVKIPEGLEPYVSDYTVNLFEIAFLTDEQVQAFQSDFRYVAEYFVANRKRKEGLEPTFSISLDHMKHVEDFIELMNAITNSDRFSSLPKVIKERGDEAVYTILFDEAEARGISIGEERGEIKGVIKLYNDEMDLSPAEIAKKIITRFSLDQDVAEQYVKSTLNLQKM